MSQNPITVFASFRPLPGKDGELRSLLSWMVGHTRSEQGCERYDLYRRQGEDASFHLFETYRDQEALEVHRASDHYVEYRRKIADLLEDPVDVVVLNGLDVAG